MFEPSQSTGQYETVIYKQIHLTDNWPERLIIVASLYAHCHFVDEAQNSKRCQDIISRLHKSAGEGWESWEVGRGMRELN
jgi:hypothetical protein